MPGPLSGLRIVDLTTVLFGPYATQLLAEMGAEVIKVESPSGDISRNIGPSRNPRMGPQFLHLNRGKRSLVLDLKKPAGREAVLRLAQTADVFIYNIRPNAMARLGLGYEDVAQSRSDIIYVGLLGYDQRGPMASRPAYDDLIQAAVGLPSLMQLAGSAEPRYVPWMLADRCAALLAVPSVLGALIHRMKTGEGQHLEVPMYEGLASMILSDHLCGETFVPALGAPGYARVLAPERRPYRTLDGYVCVLIYNQKHLKNFFSAVGREDVLLDPRFAEVANRSANISEFYTIVGDVLLQKTTAEWLELFEHIDVPASPLRDLASLIADPQLAASGLLVLEEHPTEGVVRRLNVPSAWSASQPVAGTPARRLGQDSVDILAELDFSSEQIRDLCEAGVTIDGSRTFEAS